MTLPDELRPVFEEIESRADFDIHSVANALGEYRQKQQQITSEVEFALLAEQFAFTMSIDPKQERSGWGSYFAPMFTSHGTEGIRTSHPLELLSADTIAYWSARAAEAANPMLRARYADAAWELARLVQGAKRDISNARSAIDAYITASAASNEVYPTIVALRRALQLSLSIQDDERTQHVVNEMFALADRGAEPSKIGTSIAVFDSLYELRRKVKLPDERLRKMIGDLEHYLVSAARAENPELDQWGARQYGDRLLKHYRSVGTPEDVIRVTRLIGGAIENAAEKGNPSVAAAWLHEAQVAYMKAQLKDDADRVLVKIKEKGREAKGQMVSHVETMSIPVSEVQDFLDHIAKGGLDACFLRIAEFFIPKADKLRERLAHLKANYPLSAMFPISFIEDDQMVARVGSIEDDEEGRLVHETAQEMQFWVIFLMESLERMFVEHGLLPDEFVDLLYRTDLWGTDRYQILKNGVRHYRDGDFIAAIHVLVPQIEHALRVLLSRLLRATNLYNPKTEAYQEKDLGGILADDAMKKLLGEDFSRYLRALLTDQRGWNLRNRLSHGLYSAHFFGRQTADRVVHILMVISLIRPSGTAQAV